MPQFTLPDINPPIMNTRTLALALIAIVAPLHARIWTVLHGGSRDADFVSAAQNTVEPGAPRIILAGAAPATPPAPTRPFGVRQEPPKANPYASSLASDWMQFEGKGKLQCMLFGAPVTDPTKKLPLLIYLHGKGNNVLSKAALGFADAASKPANFAERPCFILAPQCPDENGWGGVTGKNVMLTVKDLMRHLPVDADRVYLVGYSMGGYGTFMFLNSEPRTFAAGIPIAGGCSVAIAQNLRKMPLWIFHGEKDDVVKPADSRAIAKALERMKAPAKYTEYPGEGHGIPGKVSSDPAVHQWLFEQKRK